MQFLPQAWMLDKVVSDRKVTHAWHLLCVGVSMCVCVCTFSCNPLEHTHRDHLLCVMFLCVHLRWHCCSCISWWGRGWHRPGSGSHRQGCCSTEAPSGTGPHTAPPPPRTTGPQTAHKHTNTDNETRHTKWYTQTHTHACMYTQIIQVCISGLPPP